MRHRRALCAGLLAWLLAGCAGGPELPAVARPDTWRTFRPPDGPNFIQMDVALLERPVGDRYLNGELWAYTDEQVAGLEKKAVLEDNGFRVGQVVGMPPSRLHALLRSERCCVNPRRRSLLAGTPAPLLLGPALQECRYTLLRPEGPEEVSLEQAQCTLLVVPSVTADGKTRLQFTPRVEHGEPSRHLRPAPDRSGWTVETERQSHTYPEMSWDVTMGPNEYLVIGADFDQPQSLGYQCFIDRQGHTPVQRLLVLRLSGGGAGIDAEIADPAGAPGAPAMPADLAAADHPLPLALQATYSSARAASGQ